VTDPFIERLERYRASLSPALQAELDTFEKLTDHRMIHGDPEAAPPRGLLSAADDGGIPATDDKGAA
jgi:hypothetical protein